MKLSGNYKEVFSRELNELRLEFGTLCPSLAAAAAVCDNEGVDIFAPYIRAA